MAKLLKIGAAYVPNYEVPTSDGSKKIEPHVIFFFEADPRTAAIVASSCGVRNIEAKDDYVSKAIKVDLYKKFIYGQKMLPAILDAFEKNGYVYDKNNLNKLEANVEKEIQSVLSSDASSQIYADKASFIDDIIKSLEQNMQNPAFTAYVQSIGAVQYVGDDVIGKLTTLSYDNTCLVMSQWIKAGKQGQPTHLATRRQWSKFFNRDISPSGIPLYIVTPKDTVKRSKAQTMAAFGVTQAQYDADAMLQRQIDTLQNDKDYGIMNNSKFGLNGISPYYDLSDTVLQPGQPEVYDWQNNCPININVNKTKKEDEKKSEIISAVMGDRKSEADIITALTNYATKKNDTNLLAILTSKGNTVRRAFEYLAENSKTIVRENDQRKKNLYLSLLLIFLFTRFGVETDYANNLLARYSSQITNYGKLNKTAFHAVGSDFQNIVAIINGVKESVSNNTLMWMLKVLGMSVEEYKAMPDTEEEAEARLNGVRESFIRTFNNLLR